MPKVHDKDPRFGVPKLRLGDRMDVAEFFEVTPSTVDHWVRKGCPCLQRGTKGKPTVFDILEVARWRVPLEKDAGVRGATDGDGTLDPDKLPPKDQIDWANSQLKLIDLQKARQGLHTAEDVARCAAALVKTVTTALDSLPAVMERDLGLDGPTLDLVQDTVDNVREQLYQELTQDIFRAPEAEDETDEPEAE